jgi:asparagine synthase (glutamine-hydrolysing)
MCGIFGIINNNDLKIDKRKVKDSALLMNHRGPDAFDQWGIENKIELAHLRLAIIDLNVESQQPFFSSCGNYVIIFNGEIFNYLELKKELEEHGHKFRTSSDTEVLLESYIQWGDSCVTKFNGDWAFSIYNIKKNKLFCSRDRFGVKPFNYALIDKQLIFSSEIKSIIEYSDTLKEPNLNVILNFCKNSLGAQLEHTWFKGIKRLLPAHNLIWENGVVKIYKYWEYPTETFKDISYEEAKLEYNKLFQDAVKIRLRSDVPVGTTLSSGIDSSSIVSIIHKLNYDKHKTFTAHFNVGEYDAGEKSLYATDVKINESELVKKLEKRLNLDSHFIEIKNSDFINGLSKNIYHLESGHSSPATIAVSEIFDEAKKHVTVVLEGQGADELLAGYAYNLFPYFVYEELKKMRFKKLFSEFLLFRKDYSIFYSLKLFLRSMNYSCIEKLYHSLNGINSVFSENIIKNYRRLNDYPKTNLLFDQNFNKALFKSHTGGLVNLLHYGDAISMSKSIESRNPFLDYNLVEYAFKLPYSFKYNNGVGKKIHRDAMKEIVPDFILNNTIKFGFNTPLSQQFKKIDTDANKILLSKRTIDRGIFNEKGLKKIINNHINNKRNNSTLLFRLLSVEIWFREFIDK